MASRRLALLASGGGAAAAVSALWAPQPALADGSQRGSQHPWEDARAQPAARSAQLAALRRGGFDVLVIGGARAVVFARDSPQLRRPSALTGRRVHPGGATGAGAALDASTRGLRTALVEAEDFAAGTSSRSTKLIHGGVRYLEKAVWQVRVSPRLRVARALTAAATAA